MRTKEEKIELAQAFIYIGLIGLAVVCAPMIWELLCAVAVLLLQGVACILILCIILSVLESLVVWATSTAKAQVGDKTWKFA